MTETVLVVDDQSANLRLFTRLLTQSGFRVLTAEHAVEALEAVGRHHPDLVLTDVIMPGIDGFELCERLKADPRTRLIPVVLVTALSDRGDKLRGIEAGADDFLEKPVDPHELTARVRSLVRIKRYTDDLDSAEAVILSLALTIEARDPYTEGHCQRLAQYATQLGTQLGLGDDDLEALRWGGTLHDIGKIGIPDAVLLKPGRLTPEEFVVIRQHPVIGDRLLGELRSLQRVRPIVRHHHERLDGSGYPDGLKGDEVPLLARLIAIPDCFDAVTTSRAYRSALGLCPALDILRQGAGTHFDPDLVRAFLPMAPALLRTAVAAGELPVS